MRKYTATLSQVIDLNNNQLNWLCKHLGHTKRVHQEHYQTMSGFIERVKVSKLLLLQDLNLTHKYVGKKLDDISFQDIVTEKETVPLGGSTPPVESSRKRLRIEDDDDKDDDDDDGVDNDIPSRKKKRVRWTNEQIKDLYKYFKKHLDEKTTPRRNECLEKMKKMLFKC